QGKFMTEEKKKSAKDFFQEMRIIQSFFGQMQIPQPVTKIIHQYNKDDNLKKYWDFLLKEIKDYIKYFLARDPKFEEFNLVFPKTLKEITFIETTLLEKLNDKKKALKSNKQLLHNCLLFLLSNLGISGIAIGIPAAKYGLENSSVQAAIIADAVATGIL